MSCATIELRNKLRVFAYVFLMFGILELWLTLRPPQLNMGNRFGIPLPCSSCITMLKALLQWHGHTENWLKGIFCCHPNSEENTRPKCILLVLVCLSTNLNLHHGQPQPATGTPYHLVQVHAQLCIKEMAGEEVSEARSLVCGCCGPLHGWGCISFGARVWK